MSHPSAPVHAPARASTVGASPFACLEEAFRLLCAGPHPLALDGALIEERLPNRAIPFDELRARLLHPACSYATRDVALNAVLDRARAEGGAWLVGVAGLLLPGLRRAAKPLTRACPGKAADIEAEMLAGLLAAVAAAAPGRPRPAARLVWAARRAGERLLRAEHAEQAHCTGSLTLTADERRPCFWAAPASDVDEAVGGVGVGGAVHGAVEEAVVGGDELLGLLAGEVVRAIEPHTEADPVAVLSNLLAAFGNAAGRGAYVRVGASAHHLNLFCALVGESSKARKGMSWGHVRQLMHATDTPWEEDRVESGLSSGEGLIQAVRDPVVGERDGEPVVLDSGVADKRLLLVEGEFGKVLKVMAREGNVLSAVIRSAWDGDRLQTLTKNSPLKATAAHVSVIGHVTKPELVRLLTQTDTENGFANRFLWVLVRRSKALPFGGEWHLVDTAPLVRRLSEALEFAKTPRELRWGGTARKLWASVYADLSDGKPGLLGAATSRAEAQTLRLAALYAVLDLSSTIEREHLEAALAVWGYCEASARFIFGDATGDPIADRIMTALEGEPDGLTRNGIRDVFGRNVPSKRIAAALAVLEKLGRVRRETLKTGGRPAARWKANA
jgi:hypothetical protein